MGSPGKPAASANYERRIGNRHQLSVPIAWQAASTGRWRRRAQTFTAMTENLSLSGAGFVFEDQPDLRVTSMITVTIGDATGRAQVRSIRPTGGSNRSYYGIEFQDDQLLTVARALISEHLKHLADERPPTATAADPVLPSKPSYPTWP